MNSNLDEYAKVAKLAKSFLEANDKIKSAKNDANVADHNLMLANNIFMEEKAAAEAAADEAKKANDRVTLANNIVLKTNSNRKKAAEYHNAAIIDNDAAKKAYNEAKDIALKQNHLVEMKIITKIAAKKAYNAAKDVAQKVHKKKEDADDATHAAFQKLIKKRKQHDSSLSLGSFSSSNKKSKSDPSSSPTEKEYEQVQLFARIGSNEDDGSVECVLRDENGHFDGIPPNQKAFFFPNKNKIKVLIYNRTSDHNLVFDTTKYIPGIHMCIEKNRDDLKNEFELKIRRSMSI
jgi:hypothetical protein